MDDNTIDNSENTVDLRDDKGRFKEGNPGRPVGSKNYLTLLEEAIKKYETDNGKQLFDRLIQRAFINDNVLLNVIKKFLPDKSSTELTGADGQPVVINLIPIKTKEDVENLDND